jgi:hypothetical protein
MGWAICTTSRSWDRAEHGSGASTWAMMAIGFTGLGFLGFRRRNAATG